MSFNWRKNAEATILEYRLESRFHYPNYKDPKVIELREQIIKGLKEMSDEDLFHDLILYAKMKGVEDSEMD